MDNGETLTKEPGTERTERQPMNPIQWRESLSVGNEMIDNDHKKIFDIINDCQYAFEIRDLRALQYSFERLYKYADEHFDREINLQRAIHYPLFRPHMDEHDALRRRLTHIRDQAMACGPRRQIREEISDLLRDWLLDHIIKEDLKMRPYLTGAR